MASASCNKHPTLQEINVREFLLEVVECLDWDDLYKDIVMDIGCCLGDNSSKNLVKLFPRVKKVIAIDHLQSSISKAKRKNWHPKINYRVANIEDRSTLTPWMGNMSKVFSVNCFNFLTRQKMAFKNVYRLLKPGGDAAIFISLYTSYLDAFVELFEPPKWRRYFEKIRAVIPESYSKKFDASHYQRILENIGFTVVSCKEEPRTYLYSSDEECRRFITPCLLIDSIPIEKREEFREDVFAIFLKHNPEGAGQQPCLKYRSVSVFVKKPK